MRFTTIVLITLLAVVLPFGGTTPAGETTRDPEREHDRKAVVELSQDMVRAFGRRDAAAMAANWTEDGEYVQNGGQPIRGRGEIQKGYAEFFKTIQGEPKVDVQLDAVRFPSADVAQIEATLRRRNDEGEIVASARQDAVLAREGDHWKLAVVREWDRDVRPSVSLNDLEWLIGAWHAVTPDGEVSISYKWDENRSTFAGNSPSKKAAEGHRIGDGDDRQGQCRGRDSLVALPVRRRVRRRRPDAGRHEVERRYPRRPGGRQARCLSPWSTSPSTATPSPGRQ